MEEILDHYKNPRNFGKIENPDIRFHDSNPLCGDEIEIMIKLNSNKVKDVKFIAKGCAISIASASMLSEKIKNQDTGFIKNLKNQDIFDMLSINLSPIRVKCALLSLVALKKGIYGVNNAEILNHTNKLQIK